MSILITALGCHALFFPSWKKLFLVCLVGWVMNCGILKKRVVRPVQLQIPTGSHGSAQAKDNRLCCPNTEEETKQKNFTSQAGACTK